MDVKGKKIGFVLTGSFCTFHKVIPKMKELKEKGAEIIPVMSFNSYGLDTKFGKAKAIIEFINDKFVAYWDSAITHPKNGHVIACYEINKRFEVIGNIYDNPELLNY